jgi:hypothetical protein
MPVSLGKKCQLNQPNRWQIRRAAHVDVAKENRTEHSASIPVQVVSPVASSSPLVSCPPLLVLSQSQPAMGRRSSVKIFNRFEEINEGGHPNLLFPIDPSLIYFPS